MKYKRRKMVEVADRPRGFWGKRMLAKMHEGHKPLIIWGLENIYVKDYECILDLGCGSGNALEMMYESNPNAKYYGLDYSIDAVRTAILNNSRPIAAGNMEIAWGDVKAMPYDDHMFDLVVSTESFYYWEDYDKAMGEIARVLKPEGQFVVILEAFDDGTVNESNEQIKNILKNMKIMTKEEILEVYEKAGFTTVIETKGQWIRVIGTKQ